MRRGRRACTSAVHTHNRFAVGDQAEVVRRPRPPEVERCAGHQGDACEDQPDRALRPPFGLGADAELADFLLVHTALSAEMIGRREARRAGSSVPSTPTAMAKSSPLRINHGVMLNWNTVSLNVSKPMVPAAKPFIGNASAQPVTPPMKARKAP